MGFQNKQISGTVRNNPTWTVPLFLMPETLMIVVPVWKDVECMRPFYDEVIKHVPNAVIQWVIDPPVDIESIPVPGIFTIMSTRQGQEACILKGVLKSLQYDFIAIMDVDLQDPPSLLPQMMLLLKAGYDVAWPVHPETNGRNVIYRSLSWLWYQFLTFKSASIPRYAGNFCMVKRDTAKRMIESQIPFVRGAIAKASREDIVTIAFLRPARKIGKSKYNGYWGDAKSALRGLFS